MDAIKSLGKNRMRKLVELNRVVKQLKKQVAPSVPNEIRRLEEIISCVKLSRRNSKRQEQELKNKYSWSNVFPFRQLARLGVIPSRTVAAAVAVVEQTQTTPRNEVDPVEKMPELEKILIEELPHHSDPSKKEIHLHVLDSNIESMIGLISALNSESSLQPTKIYVSFTAGDFNNNDDEEEDGTDDACAAAKFSNLMLSFNQFESSLESLDLDLRRLNGKPDLKFWTNSSAKEIHLQDESWILDINLPKLKNLCITDCRGPWGFLLCFPALENLSLLKCSIGCFHNERVVQLTWEEEAMYESSIWKCLSKLKSLRMERVKEARYPEHWFPQLSLELTKEDYERFQREEKQLKMTTIVWGDARKNGSSGGRRWWRYRKY